MYEQPEDPQRCPVETWKFYLTKLNPKCPALFQRQTKNFQQKDIWYDNAPLDHNKIGDLVKQMSVDAALSKSYTNHCIRATTSTILHQAGPEAARITAVTGHKSAESLKHYIRGPTQQQMQESSSILHRYGNPGATKPESELSVDLPFTSPSGSSKNVPAGVGSLFSGATIGSNCTININLNSGQYHAAQ